MCGQLANVMPPTEYDRRPFTSTPVTADQISGLRIDAALDSRPHAEPDVADIDAVARASRAVPHRLAAVPATRRHIDWEPLRPHRRPLADLLLPPRGARTDEAHQKENA